MLRFVLVTLVALAMALALGTGVGSADERWIIEPGPEATDAQKLGAADVERAQKLAKGKHYAEAATVLESVARTWPAAVHDCNLALAYLRNNSLTRAQLVWDLGALRNGVRPKWCTGDVSTQLSEALRKAGYVPTTIDVTPPDAVVEVNGIAFRSMRTVWLPAGTATFNASASGRLPKTVQAPIGAPVSRVTITLQEPKVEMPDAAVQPVTPPVVTPDAGVAATPFVPPPMPDAGVDNSLLQVNGRPVKARRLALIAMLASGLSTAILGGLTYYEREKANDLYSTDPAFDDANERYHNLALATEIVAGTTAVCVGVFIYFSVAGDTTVPKPGKILGGGPGTIGITYGDTW